MGDSLRKAVIRLAHARPELRGELLPLLKEAAKTEAELKKDHYKYSVMHAKALKIQKEEAKRGYDGPWGKGYHIGVELQDIMQNIYMIEAQLRKMGVSFTPYMSGATPRRLHASKRRASR